MSAISETIFDTLTHPDVSVVETRRGEKFRGDGFYNRADGFHTVQWSLSNFIGNIGIQGSLAVDPQETDWFTVRLGGSSEFTVDTTGKISTILLNALAYTTPTSGAFSYNFTGNYVWVRVRINDWTAGAVNSVIMSH